MIQGLVIAAGKSRRFGKDKLIHKLRNDIPMVLQAAINMSKAVPQTLVVLNRERAHLAADFIKLGMTVELSKHSHLGMGHTIADGINASKNATGWIIAMGDMPFIEIKTINQIKYTLEKGAPIAVPTYGGQRGHPVGFSALFSQELSSLQGDIGARMLLQQYSDDITYVECDDPGIVFDIDVPEDLIELGSTL